MSAVRRSPLPHVLAILALTLALAAPALPGEASPGEPSERVDVFIGFHDTPTASERAFVERHGGTVTYSYTIVPAIAANVPARAVDQVERSSRVTYVEPVTEIFLVDHEDELGRTWGVEHIDGGDAHHEGFLGTGVRVAVLDSGITPHEDLDYEDLDQESTCSNGTSYGTIHDGHGHGTHVAGTVAALKNDRGVVGVAPEATLCVFKVLSDSGGGSYDDVVAALDFILKYNEQNSADPIRVTNNSYGSSGDPGSTVSEAFAALYQKSNVLHVAAAGNSGNLLGMGSNCIYPALYDSVMAVAATNENDTRPYFSSTCNELELSAPGVFINSTVPGGYGEMSGTSMASPHVAGTAALVFAAASDMNNHAVRDLLHETAKDLGAHRHYGHGLVQPYTAVRALNVDRKLTSVEVTPAEATIATGETQQFTATANYDDGSTRDVTGDATWTSTDDQVATVDVGGLATGESPGTATITATFDGQSDSGELTVTEPVLSAVEVSPADASIQIDETQQFTATAVYSDGTEEVVTGDATWSSTAEEVATVDGGGLATGVGSGTATITATFEGVSGSATLSVTDGTAIVEVVSIAYTTRGGPNSDRHLDITIAIVDGDSNPVADASVSATLERNGDSSWGFSGTTGSDGTVTFTLVNHGSGCYTTTVTDVSADGLTWEQGSVTDDENYCK